MTTLTQWAGQESAKWTEGAAHVDIVRYSFIEATPFVQPYIDTTATCQVVLDAGSGQTVEFVGLIVNAASDAAENAQFASKLPEIVWVFPSTEKEISIDDGITRVAVVGVATATNTGGYSVIYSSTTQSDWSTAKRVFTLTGATKIRISVSPKISQYLIFRIDGYE